jgi:hypothetical protein
VQVVKGKDLDRLANSLGLKRHKTFWVFKEPDTNLRNRCVQRVNNFCNSNLVCPSVEVMSM